MRRIRIPLRSHTPLKENLGAKSGGQSSPEGGCEGGDHIGSPHDHSRPDHRLPGTECADLEDIKWDKGQDTLEGKGDSKLRNGNKENTFVFDLEGVSPSSSRIQLSNSF